MYFPKEKTFCLSVSTVETERKRLIGHADYLENDLKEGLNGGFIGKV